MCRDATRQNNSGCDAGGFDTAWVLPKFCCVYHVHDTSFNWKESGPKSGKRYSTRGWRACMCGHTISMAASFGVVLSKQHGWHGYIHSWTMLNRGPHMINADFILKWKPGYEEWGSCDCVGGEGAKGCPVWRWGRHDADSCMLSDRFSSCGFSFSCLVLVGGDRVWCRIQSIHCNKHHCRVFGIDLHDCGGRPNEDSRIVSEIWSSCPAVYLLVVDWNSLILNVEVLWGLCDLLPGVLQVARPNMTQYCGR